MQQAPPHRQRGLLLPDTLCSITRFTSSRPKLTLWTVFLFSCLCVVLTLHFIQFKTKRSDLIDPDASFNRRWTNYTESFGEASDMIVVVEADDRQTIEEILDVLGSRVQRETQLFDNVLYKVDLSDIRGKGLQFLTPEQLEVGVNRLSTFQPILQGRWDLIRLDSLAERLEYQLKQKSERFVSPAQAATSTVSETPGTSHRADRGRPADIQDLQYLLRHAYLLSASLRRYLEEPRDFRSPWPQIVPADTQPNRSFDKFYLINEQGNLGFLKALPRTQPTGFNGHSKAIDRIHQIIAEVAEAYPTATIGLTGIPVLENDEMEKSQEDMLNASGISIVGVILLLVVGFRGVRHPFLALIMLAVGLAWTFGYTTLTIGHLNILSVSFAVILIGLGIDFAIHYLARYLELRHEGCEWQPALLETSDEVGTGIVTAAVTTSFAFFCTLLTDFLGVAELGIIAGGGILLCTVATFVVLPALLALVDSHVEPRKLPTPFQGHALRLLTSRYPVSVIVGSVTVIALLALQAFDITDGHPHWKIHYDSNLLNLQADGLESVATEKRIFHKASGSLLYAVSIADSAEQARALRARFEQLPTVDHVEELGSRLPPFASHETQLLVQAIHAQLAQFDDSHPRLVTLDPASVGDNLESLFLLLSGLQDSFARNAADALDAFLNGFEALSLAQQTQFLAQYQTRMTAALQAQFQAILEVSEPAPVSLADFSRELTSRFVSADGKWLVQVFPNEPIWDNEPLSRFVTDVRSVDPEVTGTPLQNFEASRQILESYRNAALYALAVIGLILLIDFLGRDRALLATIPTAAIVGIAATAFSLRQIDIQPVAYLIAFVVLTSATAIVLDFRSFRDTVLALLPPVGGGFLMFGILAILQIDLNPANLIVLPLILGIGVDDGVHVIHDFLRQRGTYRPSSSTINAIVLTSLTSMTGFGSLMVAAHRGLYSLGLVLLIGIGSCLLISLVLLPAILTVLSRGRSRPISSADGNEDSQLETRPRIYSAEDKVA